MISRFFNTKITGCALIFYASIFIFLVSFRFFLHNQEKLRKQLYPGFLFLVFIFSAFRFEVGCDWSGYLNQFRVQGFSTISEALERGEPLWWAMIEGLHSLGLSYPWLNVASALIFFSGIHVLARRQPDPLGFLILLFPILIINIPMSGIRQGAAIGIMCIAFASFIDKKLLLFVAWTLLASTFHSSAIVFILLAPLVAGELTKTKLTLAIILAIPGVLLILSGNAAQEAINRYIDAGYDAAGAAFRVGILSITGGVYLLVLRKGWDDAFKKDSNLVALCSMIMVLLIVIMPFSTIIPDRLGYYLIPIQAIIFSRIPYLPIKSSKKLYSSMPYLLLVLVFLVWTYFSRHFEICYVPYSTWLFGLQG